MTWQPAETVEHQGGSSRGQAAWIRPRVMGAFAARRLRIRPRWHQAEGGGGQNRGPRRKTDRIEAREMNLKKKKNTLKSNKTRIGWRWRDVGCESTRARECGQAEQSRAEPRGQVSDRPGPTSRSRVLSCRCHHTACFSSRAPARPQPLYHFRPPACGRRHCLSVSMPFYRLTRLRPPRPGAAVRFG